MYIDILKQNILTNIEKISPVTEFTFYQTTILKIPPKFVKYWLYYVKKQLHNPLPPVHQFKLYRTFMRRNPL